jgi:hypothetical protein
VRPGETVPPDQVFDDLYERYGRPLESEHAGEYLAVTLEGKTLLGPTLLEASQRALVELGRGSLVFKIGEGSTGHWR